MSRAHLKQFFFCKIFKKISACVIIKIRFKKIIIKVYEICWRHLLTSWSFLFIKKRHLFSPLLPLQIKVKMATTRNCKVHAPTTKIKRKGNFREDDDDVLAHRAPKSCAYQTQLNSIATQQQTTTLNFLLLI